jgi:hypothetical protein
MRARTIVDESAPRITNLYKTIQKILQFKEDKVMIHPADVRRVYHGLSYFVQDIHSKL